MLPWMIGLAVWGSGCARGRCGRGAVALLAVEFVVAAFNLGLLGGER
jgi:hypothetical protein